MKKNISINISGIIFHIEEDGYTKLKNYLDSINRYFSAFDDSHEIIADIEGRIAEIFLAKLKDGRQVVSLEDVESLIATMGSIRDFQAVEDDADYEKEEKRERHKVFEAPPVPEARRLYRDGKRKILGGVMAGIAHYLNLDPLWIRLIYLLLFFGVSFLEPIAGILLLLYIALWIIFPLSYELEEEEKLKKMYRDPDNKVVGGVCGGISAYFGIDVVVVRLLFVIAIFFAGTGIILYIILWLILPEAITLTDKMKMKGEPVTLSNIELNIKKSLNVKEGEENIFVKILLFPFRLIAIIFDFLSNALGPMMRFLAEAIRIFVGATLLLAGTGLILVVIVALATILGITNLDFIFFDRFPVLLLGNELTWVDTISLFLTLVIPLIFLAILGLLTLTKRKVLTPTIGWSLVALWIVSIGIMSFKIPAVAADFSDEGYYTTEKNYRIQNKTLVLKIRDTGEDAYENVELNIRRSDDGNLKIVQEFKARGIDRYAAEQNARMVDYQILQKDSVFTFDSNLTFKEDAKFRGQKLYATMYIPEGQKFKADRELEDILDNYFRRKGFSAYDLEDKTWFFKNGDLQCEGCVAQQSRRRRRQNETANATSPMTERDFAFDNFTELEIEGGFNVKVRQADEFRVSMKGNEDRLGKIAVEKRENHLSIRNEEPGNTFNNSVYIEILMPELQNFVLAGSANATINGFSGELLKIEARETSRIDFDSNVDELEVEASGSSVVTLFGTGDRLIAETENAAKLNAFDYYVDHVTITTTDASEAELYGEDRIEITAEDGSSVEYRGNARVEIERKAGAKVEED